ncbi:MAG: DoxX family protein [Candidatus Omnitrophica bacterium]|nr:DoxX family protein [Candidatus Omnitrophota bacterium]
MNHKIAILVLRVSLGVVFLIFGIGKFQNDLWAQTIKSMEIFQNLPWEISISIFAIGILEVAIGLLLIVGLFTRLAAGLAILSLLIILCLLSFQEIRDIGLLGAAVYLLIAKEKVWGIDWLIRKRFS